MIRLSTPKKVALPGGTSFMARDERRKKWSSSKCNTNRKV